MAGRIRQDDIDAVKERTDLVKLVGQYLTLKKSGHDSLTGCARSIRRSRPRSACRPAKQVFYCFGCGKGGDAITLPARARAPRRTSRRSSGWRSRPGCTLRYEGDSPAERRAAQRRGRPDPGERGGLRSSSRRCCATAREAAEARAYLEGRGITPETVDDVRHRVRAGVPGLPAAALTKSRTLGPEILLEAGLATRGDDGTVRDRFRGAHHVPDPRPAGARRSGSARGSCRTTRVPASRRST